MGVVETGAAAAGSWLSGRAFDFTGNLLQVDRLREPLVQGAGSMLERYADGDGRGRSGPGRIKRERALIASAILDTFDRQLSKRSVSPHVVRICMCTCGTNLCTSGPL